MGTSNPMTRTVVFFQPHESLRDAYELMNLIGVRHVPVLEGTEIVGTLSDRDVLLHAQPDGGDGDIEVPEVPIREVMSSTVVTCQADASIAQIAAVMLQHKISSIPVTDAQGHLQGLITTSDLLELVADTDDEFANGVPAFQFALKSLGDFAS